jgi:hypothetical protein
MTELEKQVRYDIDAKKEDTPIYDELLQENESPRTYVDASFTW